ncbi:DNA-directed RNA polymerase subunit alpha C-terminal domain-containing protein [Geodermatophilus sp. CPCC 206100]|uniref:DNA-directed RNA polymerase subunit alpha C-terminal domain-containing protein n=1 Tax=Geodermatophilus sp. CPCC 206100 TaxID=3020054 RepID=UPI003AFFBE5A
MPTTPEQPTAGTVRDLGLPTRAVTALTRAGITRADQLARLTRRDLAGIDGLGAGSIAAIRLVVPEPHQDGAPSRSPEDDAESPRALPIPSLESLRAPRGRTTVDLIVPATPPRDPAVWPAPPPPRPPEYADLWRIGRRVAGSVAGAPWRLARGSVLVPVRLVARLLGHGR